MIIRSSVTKFCEERGIPLPIKNAFSAYLRSVYAQRFSINSDTDTIRMIVGNLQDDQVEQAWKEFVTELKNQLSK